MYIRKKKIKGIEYAYLVKSSWSRRKQSPKQKTIQYLGKIYKFSKTSDINLESFLKLSDLSKYLDKSPVKRIVADLIKKELYNYGFREDNFNVWKKDNIFVNFKNKKIYNANTKKPVCIEINNNFLSTKTLRNLINFIIPPGLTDLQIGKYFANSFLSAGINIPEDRFIILSKRIINKVKN